MNIKTKASFVERNEIIDKHLKEINKYKLMTESEEKDLFVKYESAKTQAEKDSIRNEIIERNLRFNYAIAKRYSNGGELLQDLIDVGIVGMYEAFDNYDWRRDVRFCTFAQYYIRRAINGYLTKENLLVRPKNNARIAPKVKKVENDFFLKNGRKPYPIEVIDILRREYGIDVRDEMDIYGAKIDNIESYIGDEEDNVFGNSSVFNEHTAVMNEYEDDIDRSDAQDAIDTAMDALTDREKTIISMAFGYGYNREYKDKEIGARLGLTSERVRQLRHAAMKKMRSAVISR